MKRFLFTILLVTGMGALMAQDSVNITINVNMSEFTTSADGVYLAGGGTFGNPGDNLMDDSDGDDVWTITVRRPKNETSNYTFTNGNCPDYSCKESIVGQPCADGQFSDRIYRNVSADTTINTCFSECTTDLMCSPVGAPVNVTFVVDMDGQTVDPAGMFVAGSFNGWSATDNPMDDSDGDNVWEAVIPLAANPQLEYKFVNGSAFENVDALENEVCAMRFGNFVNRIVKISGNADTTLCTAPWEMCCAEQARYEVTFTIDMTGQTVDPGGVFLGANWDSWTGNLAMEDSNMDNTWSYTALLGAGDYEYKFINGPGFMNDEQFDPATDDSVCTITTPDGMFTNRLWTVTDGTDPCTPTWETCCTAASISDLIVDNSIFVLRPTITSTFAYVDFPEISGEQAELQIVNAVGQVVYKTTASTASSHRLDVQSYAQGLYFVQVRIGNSIGTQKMIVE